MIKTKKACYQAFVNGITIRAGVIACTDNNETYYNCYTKYKKDGLNVETTDAITIHDFNKAKGNCLLMLESLEQKLNKGAENVSK